MLIPNLRQGCGHASAVPREQFILVCNYLFPWIYIAGRNGQNEQAGTNGNDGAKGMKGAGEHMLLFANSDKSC
jgi:hypothetical protein